MKRLLSRDYSRKTGARRLLQQCVAGLAPFALAWLMIPSALYGQKELIAVATRVAGSLFHPRIVFPEQ